MLVLVARRKSAHARLKTDFGLQYRRLISLDPVGFQFCQGFQILQGALDFLQSFQRLACRFGQLGTLNK